ncbi:hypothetical protein OIY81_1735 [Cryptosporidium canis]|nr:hypothetical protein OIY81_1735 [Cryptosporidium canis]
MYQSEKHVFKNMLKGWFSETCISDFPEIQRLILEFSFSLETFRKLAQVNSEGLDVYRSVQRRALECIRALNKLEHQTWMNSDSKTWISWLLMKRNDTKDDTLTLVPLDSEIIMNILFKHRKLYPISYKTRIINDCDGEPFLSVELSAISLASPNHCKEDPAKPFSSIYDMLSSKSLVYGVDLVFGQRIEQLDVNRDTGGGEIIISVQPNHVFDILSHKGFLEYFNSAVFGTKRKFVLGDWSGYFMDGLKKEMFGRIMKSPLLPLKSYEKACLRPIFPFVSLLITPNFCKNRGSGFNQLTDKSALYGVCISLLEEFSQNVCNDFNSSQMVENAIHYNCPTLAFFFDSSFLVEETFQLIIDSASDRSKLHFLSNNLEPLEELCETNQLDLIWEDPNEDSPFFKSSYTSKHRPPWRTSIDNIINAMKEKQSQIISQQPSISFNHQPLRSDAGYLRRIDSSFVDLNGSLGIQGEGDYNNIDEYEDIHGNGFSSGVSSESEQNQIESPSLVTSGFVMGVRCLPASTAVTSLGSIIGNVNLSRSGSMNRTRGSALTGNQHQRLSIPCSDRTGRLSSCPTFSSIATSWGTPVPITRTIPIDDILGRKRDSIQSSAEPERNDQNELVLSEIRLRYNFDSDENEFIQQENRQSEDQDKTAEFGNFVEYDSEQDQDKMELQQKELEQVSSSLKNIKIGDSEASLLAKETLKSWKYVNYDFDEELEVFSEEYENEE